MYLLIIREISRTGEIEKFVGGIFSRKLKPQGQFSRSATNSNLIFVLALAQASVYFSRVKKFPLPI